MALAILEWLSLSRTLRLSRETTPPVRARVARKLALSRQRADAAQILWDRRHGADAMRLSREALLDALDAARLSAEPPREGDALPATPAAPPAEDEARQRLAAAGLSGRPLERVLEALRECDGVLPTWDDEVDAAAQDPFHRMQRGRGLVDRALHPRSLSPLRVWLTRVRRWVGLVTLVVGSIAAYHYATYMPPGVHATSSFDQAQQHMRAENAIDGDPETEWQLQDRTAGWLRLQLVPAQPIARLRLRNGHNRHYNDRAVRRYEVQIYLDGDMVSSVEGEFERFVEQPEWVTHEVGIEEADEIRFIAHTWHRLGAALGEIEIQAE